MQTLFGTPGPKTRSECLQERENMPIHQGIWHRDNRQASKGKAHRGEAERERAKYEQNAH